MSLQEAVVCLTSTDTFDESVTAFTPTSCAVEPLAFDWIRDEGAGAGASTVDRGNNPVTRAFDILFAILVLVAIAPALILLIVALQIEKPGPVFFVQRRVGRNGVLFPCFKLRTMDPDAADQLEKLLDESPDAQAEWIKSHKLRNDPRVTKLGRFARLFSLDELPQLANILLGHMSVVGPRPIVEAEAWRYSLAFADYCSVRPGLTGLWQVSGRNDTSYAERVRLDREYARSKCLALDLRIIARTPSVVLGTKGAY